LPQSGVERVSSFVRSRGIDTSIRELDSSTRSSELAAQALGCTVSEIAKSVVFGGEGTAVVVISGDRRVDVGKLDSLLGVRLRVATPEEVKARTGYPIGGVPPFPHVEGVVVVPDESLTRFPSVWTASGAPNAVMKVKTESLIAAIGRPPADVSES
jgi:prolyl-tRNA editing enzyme YbaK/EbsC (Cys-tRNA(Pro) deacylase)